jgi:uncharacterized Zn-binding protein involved in type VI secretion
MVDVHRNGDSRSCGATTIVSGQGFVYVNGQLWAVAGDPNTDGGGALSAGKIAAIYINGIRVIGVGDSAAADDLCPLVGGAHCSPSASSGDEKVTAS